MENRINDSEIGNKYDEILKSSSPITEFKEIPGTNNIRCTLQDGATYNVPVDSTLQSYFDKMEEHPEIDVDFGENCRDMIEILPFQNKIVLKQRMTGKVLKSLDIDSSLLSITEREVPYSSKLNPAVLTLLKDNPALLKEYVEPTGNINIIYNFAAKAEKSSENRSNKHIAKEMNKYYHSEKEYVAEQKAENQMSQKIGYVNMLDKIKSKGQDKLDAIDTTQVVETFEKRKKEFYGEVQKGVQKGVEIGAQSFQPRENSSETRTNPEDKVEIIH